MHITTLKGEPKSLTGQEAAPQLAEHNLPQAYVLTCVQCQSTITVCVYVGPDGTEVVALPSTYGGLSTPSTPEAVGYYLDQAQRSHAVNAASAAVSMYRGALEQLLYDQGFTQGMLAKKIGDLEAHTPGPEWFRDLDPEFLRVMKDLGNGSIHPNNGDVEKQKAFDDTLLLEVRALFVELLDDVYEQPSRRAARLATMKAAQAQVVNAAPAGPTGTT